jgi:hypothetical protein
MARKLVDVFSVPEAIRPILSFDLEQLVDPGRLAAMEQFGWRRQRLVEFCQRVGEGLLVG